MWPLLPTTMTITMTTVGEERRRGGEEERRRGGEEVE
jgi:hypothetical protein